MIQRRRDPLTRTTARRQVRPLLERAEAGDMEAANVLVDVLAYTTRPTLGEDLALALQGREYLNLDYPAVPRGLPVPPEEHAENLAGILSHIRHNFFPRRRPTCLPNRAELRTLIENSSRPGHVHNIRRALSRLLTEMRGACRNTNYVGHAMERANDVTGGHGVEEMRIDTRRRGELAVEYVNFGDIYVATVVFDWQALRFRVASPADIIEGWERRFGRAGEDLY